MFRATASRAVALVSCAVAKDGMTGSAGPESDPLTAGSPHDTPMPGIGASTGRPRGAGGGNVGCVAGIGGAAGAIEDGRDFRTDRGVELGRGGGSWANRYIVVAMSLPANGRSRVIISKNTTAAQLIEGPVPTDSAHDCRFPGLR